MKLYSNYKSLVYCRNILYLYDVNMVVKMFFFGKCNKKSIKCYIFFIKLLQVFNVPVVIPYIKDKDPKPVKS